MIKTDISKHTICIASIKRKVIKPYDFEWTKFYESNSDFSYSCIDLNLFQNELIICSTVIDADNYSILTTQRLITKEKGIQQEGSLKFATDKLYGDFKGYERGSHTFGLITLENGVDFKYFIEIGSASMIMIYGVRTLIRML